MSKCIDSHPSDAELFNSQVNDMAPSLTKKHLHNSTCNSEQTTM